MSRRPLQPRRRGVPAQAQEGNGIRVGGSGALSSHGTGSASGHERAGGSRPGGVKALGDPENTRDRGTGRTDPREDRSKRTRTKLRGPKKGATAPRAYHQRT